MPAYEYKCSTCASTVTIIRSITEMEALPVCITCAIELTRVYDTPAVTFKGNGWGAGD